MVGPVAGGRSRELLGSSPPGGEGSGAALSQAVGQPGSEEAFVLGPRQLTVHCGGRVRWVEEEHSSVPAGTHD